MYKAKVFVSLKPDVMDPQGQTIRSALGTFGYMDVSRVEVGRYFVLTFDKKDRARVEEDVKKIAHDILSNPVIEIFSYEIEEAQEQ